MPRTRPPRLHIERIYDGDGSPGYRVLVDRLWPRGVKKTEAHVDQWAKGLAPSTELRKWYGHDPALFEEFACRYRDELRHDDAAGAARALVERAHREPVVLVTATRDVEHSGARVLHEYLIDLT